MQEIGNQNQNSEKTHHTFEILNPCFRAAVTTESVVFKSKKCCVLSRYSTLFPDMKSEFIVTKPILLFLFLSFKYEKANFWNCCF